MTSSYVAPYTSSYVAPSYSYAAPLVSSVVRPLTASYVVKYIKNLIIYYYIGSSILILLMVNNISFKNHNNLYYIYFQIILSNIVFIFLYKFSKFITMNFILLDKDNINFIIRLLKSSLVHSNELTIHFSD